MTETKTTRIWTVLLPAIVIPFFSSLFYFVLFSEYSFAKAIYSGTKIFTLLWPLLAVKFILKEPLGLTIKSKNHIKALPAGIFLGGVVVALMFGIMASPVGDIVNSGAESIKTKTVQLGILEYYWSFAIFLSVIHSLIEEYYWRWFLFGYLRKVVSLPLAHILAGIAFAAHHVVVATQYFPFYWGVAFGSAVGIGGILWSLLYDKQKSLAGIWISHMIVDFGIMAIGHKLIFGTYF